MTIFNQNKPGAFVKALVASAYPELERPEWVTCIARDHSDHAGKSWCGGDVSLGFMLTGIDHAAELHGSGSRLQVCRRCSLAAQAALVDSTWDGQR